MVLCLLEIAVGNEQGGNSNFKEPSVAIVVQNSLISLQITFSKNFFLTALAFAVRGVIKAQLTC